VARRGSVRPERQRAVARLARSVTGAPCKADVRLAPRGAVVLERLEEVVGEHLRPIL
jgi:hypothetical protein